MCLSVQLHSMKKTQRAAKELQLSVNLWSHILSFCCVVDHERARRSCKAIEQGAKNSLSWPPALTFTGRCPVTVYQRSFQSRPHTIVVERARNAFFSSVDFTSPALSSARTLVLNRCGPPVSMFTSVESIVYRNQRLELLYLPRSLKRLDFEGPGFFAEGWRYMRRAAEDPYQLTHITIRGFDSDFLDFREVPAFPALERLDVVVSEKRQKPVFLIYRFPWKEERHNIKTLSLTSPTSFDLDFNSLTLFHGVKALKHSDILSNGGSFPHPGAPLAESVEFYCDVGAFREWTYDLLLTRGQWAPGTRCFYLSNSPGMKAAEFEIAAACFIQCSSQAELLDLYEQHAVQGVNVPPRDGKIRVYFC